MIGVDFGTESGRALLVELANGRELATAAHGELPKNGLVTWTGGNISVRDPTTNLVVSKPSGVMYDELRPEDHVVLDLEGFIVEGTLKPSSDTASHLYIYRQRPDVNGIAHSHSPYPRRSRRWGGPIAGMEFLLIDKPTNVADFKKELRWNDLYYHLATGL